LREKVRFFSNSVVVVFDKGSTIRPFDKLRVVSLSNHKLRVVSLSNHKLRVVSLSNHKLRVVSLRP
jgi:hypothetical protein